MITQAGFVHRPSFRPSGVPVRAGREFKLTTQALKSQDNYTTTGTDKPGKISGNGPACLGFALFPYTLYTSLDFAQTLRWLSIWNACIQARDP